MPTKTAVDVTGDAALAAGRLCANAADRFFKARAAYETARADYDAACVVFDAARADYVDACVDAGLWIEAVKVELCVPPEE